MTRGRPITLVLGVISLIGAARFLQSDPLFGLASFVLSILFFMKYFSERWRTFVSGHRISMGAGLTLIFLAAGIYYLRAGNSEFALIFGFGVLLMGVLLALDFYSERYITT